MNTTHDRFAHHPELRDKIKDPLTSFFRDFKVREVFKDQPQLHWVLDVLHTDAERAISRKQTLDTHHDGDLWVFAYGSLMWDPAMIFAEVRRAAVPDHARRFILKDIWGGRGTPEVPGLMAALDTGDGCEGLVYRIARDKIEMETEILWRREMVGPGYLPKFVDGWMDDEPVRALAFVADYAADAMKPDLTHTEQVAYCATGKGLLGTSFEYLENIVGQFATLGVVDEHCSALLADVEAYVRNAQPVVEGMTN